MRSHSYSPALISFKGMEKKVSLFLLSMFDKIYKNIGNTKQINNDRYPKFYLPSFDIEVDVKVLPLGWNTQKNY